MPLRRSAKVVMLFERLLQEPWGRTAPRPVDNPAETRAFCGDGRDILLQGFHWDSHRGAPENGKSGAQAAGIASSRRTPRRSAQAGFTWVWFPPRSDSLAPQGYIPRRWNVLDSAYGSEAELRAAIAALGPVKAMADVVLNHRVGVHTGGADFDDPPFPDNRAAICRDDESGVGTGNPDTGERHPVRPRPRPHQPRRPRSRSRTICAC